MLKRIKDKIDFIILDILLPIILNFYERSIKFRIMRAWGAAHLKRIKNKGKNVSIVGYSRIVNAENLILGNNVRIGYNCYFFCKGGVEIGDNTILSRNITIYSSNHDFNSGDMIPYNSNYVHKKVLIGNGVWVGMNVNIIPGVTIGDGAIIGMNVTVSKDVQPGEVLVSNKNRVVALRDMDKFKFNLDNNNIFSVKFPKS
jgi:acetyltransferase-like isoleucine patch superfamily enzyme